MTKIEWTDQTWNPVTGCTRVSPGCDNCYMFAQYPRLKAMGVKGYHDSPDTVQLQPLRLHEPLKWRKPRMVFVCSMSDLFHPDVPFKYVARIFREMVATPHTYQLLTKRPGRAVAFAHYWGIASPFRLRSWPSNVWIGTSVETQKYAPRLTVLGRISDATRFVSAEPLLEGLDITQWLEDGTLHWVIAGGESGPRARPMDEAWARGLRDQCLDAKVPFFLKQLGGRRDPLRDDKALLDGELWKQWPKGDQE